MAKALSSAGILTFLVPDSSVYAIMSRITKVILGAHAILANGGVFATAGSSLAATAAHAHSTPVVVCAGQFKLTPKWTVYRSQGALDFENPSHVLTFREGNFGDNVDVVNPSFDYLSSSLVDVFVTNEYVSWFHLPTCLPDLVLRIAEIIRHPLYIGLFMTIFWRHY